MKTKKLSKHTLKIYLFTLILFMFIITLGNYFVIKYELEQGFYTLTMTQSNQFLTEFNAFYDSNDLLLKSLSESPDIIRILDSFNYINIHNAVTSNNNYNYITKLLQSVTHNNNNISSATLTLYDRKAIIYDNGRVYDMQLNEPLSNSQNDNTSMDQATDLLFPAYYDLNSNQLVIGMRRILYDHGKPIGAFTLQYDHNTFNDVLFPSESTDKKVIIFNTSGMILYASEDNTMNWQSLSDFDSHFLTQLTDIVARGEEVAFVGKLNDKDYTFYFKILGDKDLYFFTGFENQALKRSILTRTGMLSAISLGFLSIYIIFCTYRQSNIDKQLRSLIDAIQNASNGLFKFLEPKTDPETISILIEKYNELLNSLETISSNIFGISINIHQYATTLNEDSEINSKAIHQISNAILTISVDTMQQVEEIETLETLSKSMKIKVEKITTAFNALQEEIKKVESSHQFEWASPILLEIHSDIEYLNARENDSLKHLKKLSNASKKNAFVSREIKVSIDQQRDTLKNMSKVITNLYRTSLNLNNNLSRFKIKIKSEEKHPS